MLNLSNVKLLLLVGVFFSFNLVSAQNNRYTISEDKSEITLVPDVDINALLGQDSISMSNNGNPYRIAISYTIQMDLTTIGTWTKGDKENRWRLTVIAPKSHGMIAYFDQFFIPNGGQLHVYNEDAPEDGSVYTYNQNPINGKYSVEILAGDKMILVYAAPKKQTSKPIFHLSDLAYKYKETNEMFYMLDNKIKGFNDSRNTCIPNINCLEGASWQKQKQGVVRLRIKAPNNDIYACSGSLINNVKKDKTPYVLTASHCFFYNNSIANMAATEFIFDYETATCDDYTNEPILKKIIGAEMIASSPMQGGSDGTLVKIAQLIPSTFDVYYNGWTLNNTAETIKAGAIIHHPQGDVKKISIYSASPTVTTWNDGKGTIGTPDAHWNVTYSSGVTQGGSSGSPMFDQNGLIVGTLTGGSSSCSNIYGSDDYGKFYFHWNKDKNPDNQMQKYLDPENTGVSSLAGMFPDNTVVPDPVKLPAVMVYWEGSDLQIFSNKGVITKIRVIDLDGNFIFKQDNYKTIRATVPASTWNRGVYIISVDTEKNTTKAIRIIK